MGYHTYVQPSYDVIPYQSLLVFMIASLGFYKATLYVLPPFIPNDYLWENHSTQEGTEKWSNYARAVRDIMSKAVGLGKSDQPLREKMSLQRFLQGDSNELNVGGETYTADGVFGPDSKFKKEK